MEEAYFMTPLGFSIFFAFVIVAASGGHAIAVTCAPAKLVHMRITNVTPGVDPASFGGAPRDFYRLGSGKLRIEEAPDTANHIHGLIVNAEPNMWIVNLYDHIGKHGVDPGPTYFAKAPILGMGLSKQLMDLEFGCEQNFIAAYAPRPVRTERVNGTEYRVYRFAQGSDAVEILERPAANAPSFVRYYKNGTLGMALRYDLYQPGLAANPALFVKPAGIQYTEGSGH
jgi:hypothetical protein